MSGRALVVPAAGAGSRLGMGLPKALVPVGGVPMVRRVLSLYSTYVDSAVVVASSAARHAVEECVGADARVVVQVRPTGMLDAILIAAPEVPAGAEVVWITWCDQVAVDPATVARLAECGAANPDAAVVMPVVRRSGPYIHFVRDAAGRIVRVLQRREGDAMPAQGESDMGLFALSREAYHELLPEFAREPSAGAATGERNFLPFIPWAAERRKVVAFPCTHPMEAMGVNTPAELSAVEAYLQSRAAP